MPLMMPRAIWILKATSLIAIGKIGRQPPSLSAL